MPYITKKNCSLCRKEIEITHFNKKKKILDTLCCLDCIEIKLPELIVSLNDEDEYPTKVYFQKVFRDNVLFVRKNIDKTFLVGEVKCSCGCSL